MKDEWSRHLLGLCLQNSAASWKRIITIWEWEEYSVLLECSSTKNTDFFYDFDQVTSAFMAEAGGEVVWLRESSWQLQNLDQQLKILSPPILLTAILFSSISACPWPNEKVRFGWAVAWKDKLSGNWGCVFGILSFSICSVFFEGI